MSKPMSGPGSTALLRGDVAEFRYQDDRPVLQDICIELHSGAVTALVGRNGAGKTTLMSILAGVRTPSVGSVVTQTLRPVGYAPQGVALYSPLTVEQNLDYFERLYLAPLRLRPSLGYREELCDDLGLSDLLTRRVQTLSGGEARRTHVASSLVHEPDIVILDEPTAGVDTETRERLVAFVRRLADHGKAVVYSTHYLTELEGLADEVMLLEDGTAVLSGQADDLIARLVTPEIRLRFAPGTTFRPAGSRSDGDGWTTMAVADPAQAIGHLLHEAQAQGAVIDDLRIEPATINSLLKRIPIAQQSDSSS